MRALGVALLVSTLIACPYICGAAEAHPSSHDAEAPDSGPCEPGAPSHCPSESGSCICQGAIRDSNVQLHDMGRLSSSLFTLLPIHSAYLGVFLLDSTLPHTPFALSKCANSLSVCALLQTLRC